MSYQEKRSLLYMVSSLVTMVIYGLVVYNGYKNGSYDTSNLLQFYGRVILIYLPITIVVRIVVTILYTIANAISTEIKGEEQEDINLSDERDKLIELKAMRVSLIVFMVGFIVGLFFLAFGFSAHYFFLTLILIGTLSEIGETGLTVLYYRKGV